MNDDIFPNATIIHKTYPKKGKLPKNFQTIQMNIKQFDFIY